MRLVVDTLVGELLRDRGLELLTDPLLDLYVSVYVSARMWEETRHEVSKRLDIRVSGSCRGRSGAGGSWLARRFTSI